MTTKEERKQKAQERRAKLTEVWKQVAELSDEEKERMIENMPIVHSCEGRQLSANNTLLLAFQLQTVTVVGGYRQWQQYGRQVRKGESALGLWIPKIKKNGKNETTQTDEEDRPLFFFGSVFDITQTEEMETAQ